MQSFIRYLQSILIKFSYIMGFIGCLLWYVLYLQPNVLIEQSNRLLIIHFECTLQKLISILKQEGYITYTLPFRLTAHLLKYKPQKTPGQYLLHSNTANWKTVKMLRNAQQYPIRLTFSMATDKKDLAKQIAKYTSIHTEQFLSLLNNAKKLQPYGFTPENVLTMFIPNTYEVYWTISPEKFFDKMYKAYKKFWNPTRLKKAASINLSPIEISILASIVQAETNNKQEAAMIAGVYINRLKRNMRLQSCPSVTYILKQKNIQVKNRILLEDTKVSSPYNTYRIKGLPPGPIALPSVQMIDSVLNYVKHNYLFFSAKEDFSKTHYFSKTYQEHLKHAAKYRTTLNKYKIFR